MELDALLLIVRALAHLATFGIVFSYFDPSARYRIGVSLLAFCVAGGSLAATVQIVTRWPDMLQSGPQAPQTILALAFLVPIALTRGNLAKLLPRIKWQ